MFRVSSATSASYQTHVPSGKRPFRPITLDVGGLVMALTLDGQTVRPPLNPDEEALLFSFECS